MVPKEEAPDGKQRAQRNCLCKKSVIYVAGSCRFLRGIGRDWGHTWVKVWEVSPEVVRRLRLPESKPRQLEVCRMVDWKHVLSSMFTVLVPNIVKKHLKNNET